jgi:hypothetical protein
VTVSGARTAFCRELERAGAVLDRPETPTDEIEQAEGLRYLTRLLRLGLDLTLEADPRSPELVPAQGRRFGDGGNTADCVYLHAVVDGRRRYRIVGTRGDAPFLEIGLYAGKIGLDAMSRRIDARCETDLVVGEDGSLEVFIGRGPDGAPNVLRTADDASYVFIRQYAHDWSTTRPGSLRLECLDDDAASALPLSPAAAVTGLERAARFVHDAALAWASVVDGARRGPANRLTPVTDDLDATMPSGHRFAFGHFDLADDEALVVELSPQPDVPYWGLTINTHWFEVVDYGDEGSHVNNRTVVAEPDGRVRVLIARRRPQAANWIDTRGHRVGALVFRWSRTDRPMPSLTTTVVPVASLTG